ncbi:hypothetical protein XM38_044240 [Halomicronema hongdechloris C2206]|uniref:Uncharacterized protein n=1 Tax=Halomicronema hongdechloris C2206 TaxID=1641165 RepID=A0A1Z3HTK5_9CYAN|nr:DUF6439 family protein [Halomicronema hongdechloris]ASC73457.1 hypothetical protein XM38_044240 [Halomicronema hongdechloris C2206]
MPDTPAKSSPGRETSAQLQQYTALELAQALAEKLAIEPNDWHRLNRNRKVRAKEQLAAALVYLLSDQPEEALMRTQQASGWLDHSLTAPPCPTHGPRTR